MAKEKKRIYFVTGNKNKVRIFQEVLNPNYEVVPITPVKPIKELESKSVQKVVVDKLNKAVKQFADKSGFFFVTDVVFYINQLNGKPGGLIKRYTNRKFNGDFAGWCDYLNPDKKRDAHIQVIIAGKTQHSKKVIVDHKVIGSIPKKPKNGVYGFDWDCIFVPKLVAKKYQGKSFAQIPTNIKMEILRKPVIKKFKQRLDNLL